MSGRQDRVAVAIRKEVASLILFEMRDPRLAKVTITNATVSRDLTQARVYVSVLGDQAALDAAVEALTSAAGFVRSKVGPKLHLRTVPDFVFVPDDSAAKAQRLDKIFKEHEAEFGPIEAKPKLVDVDDLDDDDDDDDEEDFEDDDVLDYGDDEDEDDFDLDDPDLADEGFEDDDE